MQTFKAVVPLAIEIDVAPLVCGRHHWTARAGGATIAGGWAPCAEEAQARAEQALREKLSPCLKFTTPPEVVAS